MSFLGAGELFDVRVDQLMKLADKLVAIKRLADKGVATIGLRERGGLVFGQCCQKNNGDIGIQTVREQFFVDLRAVLFLQNNIENNGIRLLAENFLSEFSGIACGNHFESGQNEGVSEEFPYGRIVIHDQNFRFHLSPNRGIDSM